MRRIDRIQDQVNATYPSGGIWADIADLLVVFHAAAKLRAYCGSENTPTALVEPPLHLWNALCDGLDVLEKDR